MSSMPPGWPPTGSAPAQPAKAKPGVAGIVIGIVLMVLGPVIGIIVIVMTAIGSTSGVSAAESFSSDETIQVSLTAGQETGIWANPPYGIAECDVTGPSGAEVTMDFSFMSQEVDGYGVIDTFTPTTTGVYTADCEDPTGQSLFKVAPTMQTGSLAAGIVVGILLIILPALGGLILLIVSIVRRSNWNRTYGSAPRPPAQPSPYAAQPPSSYPGQPPSYPGQPVTYPGQPQPPYAGGQPPAYPDQPSSYPGQPTSYPSQPSSYPSQPSSGPSQPPSYPSQPQSPDAGFQQPSYPGQPQPPYPGQQPETPPAPDQPLYPPQS